MINTLAAYIIEGVENFWEVSIFGFSGNALEMLPRVCDEFLMSRQAAKKFLKELGVVYRGSKASATERKQALENLGFYCELIHVGSSLLDEITESEIIEMLCVANDGTLDGLYLAKGDELMEYAIFHPSGEMLLLFDFFDEDDEERVFWFYLACIRFLAKHCAFIPENVS